MPRDSSTPRSASAKPPDDPRRPPRLKEITEAAERIARFVHRTPVLTCSEIDRRVGARLLFKCESFQKAGAFKIRGATNMVQQISAQHAERGVATHSSGNHAAALALAARQRAVPALIVMPRNAPRVKTAAVRDYGGEITFCEPTIEARHRALEQILEARGCCFVPPYDHPWIIAGQGTVGLELLAQAGPLEAIIAPVGGGRLLSGVSLAVRAISPRTQIFGAEPESADDAARSLEAGRLLDNAHPRTIADGLLAPLSELTFGILRR
ncbi:MAG: pyridoxal-phosphate dependent enzyme, partial [Acidobacteriota bacterium]